MTMLRCSMCPSRDSRLRLRMTLCIY